jgi:hypothetical protein
MRRRRLVVDGLDAECVKIENDKAIVNTQDADQSISQASASMTSLTRTQLEEVSCQGDGMTTQGDWSHQPRGLGLPIDSDSPPALVFDRR